MNENSVNYFEYSVFKKNSKFQNFFCFFYKLLTVILTVCLIILALSLSDKLAKEAYLPILFSSPVVGLFFALGIIYFINGNFHKSFEYEISGGMLKIVEFRGKHFFGYTYKTTLIDKKISEIETLELFEIITPEEKASSVYATSGNTDRNLCFAVISENGKHKTVVFECPDKMKTLLNFYNGENAFSR